MTAINIEELKALAKHYRQLENCYRLYAQEIERIVRSRTYSDKIYGDMKRV